MFQYQLDKPTNVVEILETSIEKFPDRPLMGAKNKKGEYEWITYKDFGKRVDNLRSGMSQMGVGKNDAVGIISNNSIDWAVAFFATMGLGARFVPMYEAELLHVWKYIITDAGVKLLFVSKPEINNKIKEFTGSIPSLKKILLIEGQGADTMAEVEKKGSTKPVPSIHPDAEDIGILIYTSGTTGDPKGVLLSQGNLSSNSHARIKMFPRLNINDTTLSILPWAHVYGLGELITLVQVGGSVGLAESVNTIGDDLVKVRPTFLIAVPRVFNKIYDGLWAKMNEEGGLPKKLFVMGVESAKKKRELAKEGKSDFMTNLKFAIADKIVFSKVRAKLGGRLEGTLTGSAAMNVEISHFFWDMGIPLYDVYGLTETTPAATMNSPTHYRIGSVGRAIDKVKIVIDKSVVGPDANDGEIVIYGPNVMKGYHNKPDATKAVMTDDGGFRTGDRGRLDGDGYLYITGRIKEQFKLENGKYVFPAALEEDIRLITYIENAMIHGDGRAYNICLIIPDFIVLKKYAEKHNLPADPKEMVKSQEIKTLIETEINNFLKDKYASYEIPKKFIYISEPFTLENGMLTQTMKLKRRVVFDKYKDQMEALYKC